MKGRIRESDLYNLAMKCGLIIQHDCGGFRVVATDNSHVYPNGGVCPTATKRECWTFLSGYILGKKNHHGTEQPR